MKHCLFIALLVCSQVQAQESNLRIDPRFSVQFSNQMRQAWNQAPEEVRSIPINVVPASGPVTWINHPRYVIPTIGLDRRSIGDFMHELGHVAHAQCLTYEEAQEWIRFQPRRPWEQFAETFRVAYSNPSQRTLRRPAVIRLRSYFK